MALPSWFFRLAAHPYDWLSSASPWERHARSLVEPKGGRTILDLGCGSGASSRAIAAACPDDVVVGADLVERMLRLAIRRGDELPWVQADAAALPFRGSSVDVVTGHSLLYLLPDRHRALAEIHRVLRPGGSLALLEPREQSLEEAARSLRDCLRAHGGHFALTMALWRVAARGAGAFTAEGLRRALLSAGFEGIEIGERLFGMGLLARARRAPAVAVAAGA